MHLSYGDLEDFIATLHCVDNTKRTALKGRLKHFQRLGWPAGTNKGKGARVQYGVGQTMSLAVGMEMLQLGLTPERVVAQLGLAGGILAEGFIEALEEYGPEEDAIYYIFSPESLITLRGEEGEIPLQALMTSRSVLSELLKKATPFLGRRRFAVINISDLLTAYIDYFIDKGLGDPQRLKEPLQTWRAVERRISEARTEQALVAPQT